jgi:hypothetical protein
MKRIKLFEQFIAEDDQIHGGLSDEMTAKDIAKRHDVDINDILAALDKGQKVEMEHTDDPAIAHEIAKDHLFEDPHYYDKLAKMEDEPTHEYDNALKVKRLQMQDEDDKEYITVEGVTVLADRYVRSHNKTPKGWGKWMFSYNKNGDDYFEVPGSMSFADAVKWVKGKAKEDKQDYVYVMEGNDHEVGMAQGQLEAIHKAAGELQEKIGTEEKDLPGWIQSHITSSYEYLKQANDNYHELEESAEVNEKLKMLMAPLMVKIMKQFGFNSDPGIKAELRAEIQAAVEEVLKKHDIIVEGFQAEAEEPLAKLALSLLAIRDQAHMFHWQTMSYEQHVAFGEFYEDFAEKMDELMENIMGKGERPAFTEGTITLVGHSDDEVLQFSNTIENVLNIELPNVVPAEGNDEIYNIVDEILAMVNKLKYLLTLK